MALTDPLDRLTKQLNDAALALRGAEAGAERLRELTAQYLGGDLSMSGVETGEAEFDTSRTTAKRVVVVGVGATFALADKGRHKTTRATAERGTAINTPWGPRQSVAGSVWAGFGITERHGAEVLQAASDAFVDGIEWGT